MDRLTTSPTPAVPPIPYPGGSPLFGHAAEFANDGLRFYQNCERLGPVVRSRMLWRNVYVVTGPEAIRDVLVNHHRCFAKPYVLRRLKLVFGDSLLTGDGEAWLHTRRLVQPAFQHGRVQAFAEVARANAVRLADRWAGTKERNVYPDLVDVCLDNLTRTMLGTSDRELAELVRRLVHACHALAHEVSNLVKPPPTAYPGTLRRELRAAQKAIYRYLDNLIAERRRRPTDDFLGLLVAGKGHTGKPMGLKRIRDETVTMLLAGHETAAAALIWGLYLLATHPLEADRLASDLREVLGGDAPAPAHMDRLPRLRATLDEILRLYPPTHRIGRTVVAPVRVGGCDLRVGSDLLVPQWAVHRSPRYYREPESFRPDRWTPAFRASLPKYAFFPFSGGPRSCVGTNLVWIEDAIVLGTLAQRFRFELADPRPVVPYEGLTLVPSGERLELRITERPAATDDGCLQAGRVTAPSSWAMAASRRPAVSSLTNGDR